MIGDLNSGIGSRAAHVAPNHMNQQRVATIYKPDVAGG